VRRREGSYAEARCYTGQRVIIPHAEQIAIPELPSGFAGRGPEFTTCRNYRFGVHAYMLGSGGPSRRPNPDGTYGRRPSVVGRRRSDRAALIDGHREL
jgi:hypothetical protein